MNAPACLFLLVLAVADQSVWEARNCNLAVTKVADAESFKPDSIDSRDRA